MSGDDERADGPPQAEVLRLGEAIGLLRRYEETQAEGRRLLEEPLVDIDPETATERAIKRLQDEGERSLRRLVSDPGYAGLVAWCQKRRGDAADHVPSSSGAVELAGELATSMRRSSGFVYNLPLLVAVERMGGARRKRVNPNDPRDRWIYEALHTEKGLQAILAELRDLRSRQHPEWEPIDSIQGLKLAGDRYASRHKVTPVPRRK